MTFEFYFVFNLKCHVAALCAGHGAGAEQRGRPWAGGLQQDFAALQAWGSEEQSCGVAQEYLIHMEIPHWSFKIPFPSFKSARGFLQLIHGHCQMNLRE